MPEKEPEKEPDFNPLVPIKLDKERNLKYRFQVVRDLLEKTKINLLTDDGQKRLSSVTPDEFAVLLWAMLRHEDEALTVEQVAEMIKDVNPNEVTFKVAQAMVKVSPKLKDKEAKKETSPLPSLNSGPTEDKT